MEPIDNRIQEILNTSVEHITFNRQDIVLQKISESDTKPSSKRFYQIIKPLVAVAAAVMVISSISLGSISIVLPHGTIQPEEQIIVTSGVSFAALQHLVQ